MNISDFLSSKEILCQLAEEAAELSQAALKLRRAIDGQNPTPKTYDECKVRLCEEVADVLVCLEDTDLLDGTDLDMIDVFLTTKHDRWLSRLLTRKDV